MREAVTAHYATVLGLQASAQQAARTAWDQVNPRMIRQSWQAVAPSLTARLRLIQARAAILGATYGALALGEAGTYTAPTSLTDPSAFTGWLVDDDAPHWQVPLDAAVSAASVRPLTLIADGMETSAAMGSGRQALTALAVTAVADAARQAASVDLITRPGVGYTRMLNPPSCARCVVLAGRWYRWNAGFQRHPLCDCVHVPTTSGSQAAAKAEGLLTDPYAYFDDLSADEQARIFTKAGAQAIRDGADVYQVVNARRGMAGANRVRNGRRLNLSPSDPRRRWTREGTTPRSNYYRTGGRKAFRLTPEGIYSQAANRQEAIDLLTEYGYILPAGQVPGGAITGPTYQGFGQMGHGGQRRKASQAVLEAAATGQRDPASRYTMTAAERRVADARWRWDTSRMGIDPTSPGAIEMRGGARIGGTILPSTPEMTAAYEREWRMWAARGGQIYLD